MTRTVTARGGHLIEPAGDRYLDVAAIDPAHSEDLLLRRMTTEQALILPSPLHVRQARRWQAMRMRPPRLDWAEFSVAHLTSLICCRISRRPENVVVCSAATVAPRLQLERAVADHANLGLRVNASKGTVAALALLEDRTAGAAKARKSTAPQI